MNPTVEAREPITASSGKAAAMMLGATGFAAFGFFAGDAEGTTARLVANGAGIAAVSLVLIGILAFRSRHRAESGRGGHWGLGLLVAGLICTAAGCLVNAAGPMLPEDAAAGFAFAAIPAWSLSHLIYIGATVLGIACLRRRTVPRPLAVLLTASLPLLIVGVLLGTTLSGAASHTVTWIATEGQAGAAWFLIATRLRARPGI
ncbi:hypothetical protein AB0B28_20755 [Glycomyces sp. NPDC046736]|uniref:hypothetical protein n=1 Tax=Glycomyces sp. NPDC046736 TaxID=3155615 RepID=UPI0033FE65C4